MFNPKRKTRYINWKTNNTIVPDGSLERLFKKTESYERKNGKDVCNFVESEIVEFYKMLNTRSIGTITNLNSQLAQYTDWCLSQGLVADGQNHFRIIKRKDFEKCLNVAAIKKLIITREDLLKSIRPLVNPRDKFLILYFFEVGTRNAKDELPVLTIDKIEGNVLHLLDRDVTISEELVEFANQAVEETQIYPYGTRSKIESYTVEDNEVIIKVRESTKNRIPSAHRYYTIFTKAMNYIDLGMYKPKEIEYMGRISLLKELGDKNGISIYQSIQDPNNYKKVKNQYGCNESWQSFWRSIEGYR